MVVAITGADGFVGSNIARYLEQKHQKIRRVIRKDTGEMAGTMRFDWLEGASAVIHTAAVAHSGHKLSQQQIEHIQRVNSDAAVEIATAAAERGVGRFMFLSSAHVYGRSARGMLNEDSEMLPTNIYGATKMDAENRLVELAEKNGLELIILRPPLIYGQGVKANFLALMKLVASGLPLPFAALSEQRSYLFVDNLADGIFNLFRTEQPCWNDVYNIADAAPLSLRELTGELKTALGRNNLSLYVPKWLLQAGLEVTGRRHMIEALCKPLVLDTRSLQQILSWTPPFTTQQGIGQTVEWFVSSRART